MQSNIAVTKAMIAYAKKHHLTVPPGVSTVIPVWGRGKRTLAWRVSAHALKHADAHKTQRLCDLLFPDLVPALHIIHPRYRWSGPLSRRSGNPPGIVWHHAAGYGSPAQIHQVHLNIGDRGIAYHLYVRLDGKVYAGRPEGVWGAHCLNHNDWIGVCAEGNYDKTGAVMPTAQLKAMQSVHRYLHRKYGVVDKRHRDMPQNATACPGRNYPWKQIVAVK